MKKLKNVIIARRTGYEPLRKPGVLDREWVLIKKRHQADVRRLLSEEIDAEPPFTGFRAWLTA